MFKKIALLLLAIGILLSCTRDDLCPANTATTPSMVVVFNDFQNTDTRKTVEGLRVETDDLERKVVVARSTKDSIVLPLNVNGQETAYRFIKTTITETDTILKIDNILFTYDKNDVYINRACGFRAEFRNVNADWQSQGNEIGRASCRERV